MLTIIEIDTTHVDGKTRDYKRNTTPALNALVHDLESRLHTPISYPGKQIPLADLSEGYSSGIELIHKVIDNNFESEPRGLYFFGNFNNKSFSAAIPFTNEKFLNFNIE